MRARVARHPDAGGRPQIGHFRNDINRLCEIGFVLPNRCTGAGAAGQRGPGGSAFLHVVQRNKGVMRNWLCFAESLHRRGSGGPKGTGRVRVPPCCSTEQRGYAKLGSFCRIAAPAHHGGPKGTGRVRIPPDCSTKQRGYAKLASFCHFLLSASSPRPAARAAAAARLAQDAPADPVRAPGIGPERARAGSSREAAGRGSARAGSAAQTMTLVRNAGWSTLLPPARFSPAWRDSGPGAGRRAPHHGPATPSAGERRADHDPGETCGLVVGGLAL